MLNLCNFPSFLQSVSGRHAYHTRPECRPEFNYSIFSDWQWYVKCTYPSLPALYHISTQSGQHRTAAIKQQYEEPVLLTSVVFVVGLQSTLYSRSLSVRHKPPVRQSVSPATRYNFDTYGTTTNKKGRQRAVPNTASFTRLWNAISQNSESRYSFVSFKDS